MEFTRRDISNIGQLLFVILEDYRDFLGRVVHFEDFQEFRLTPDKPYAGRADVPVTMYGKDVGNLVVLALQSGDGTGSESDKYKLEDYNVPRYLLFETDRNNPSVLMPRDKTGIFCELFFPLFTMAGDRCYYRNLASLDELTLQGDCVVPELTLGFQRDEFLRRMGSRKNSDPSVMLTMNEGLKNFPKFGNPHAIYNRFHGYDLTQFVGFLALKDEDNPFIETFDNWFFPERN